MGRARNDSMAASPSEIKVVGRFLASRGGWALSADQQQTGPVDATAACGWIRLAGAIEAGAIGCVTAGGAGGDSSGRPVCISHAKRGVHPPACIQEPSVELFRAISAGGAWTYPADDGRPGTAAFGGADSNARLRGGVRVSMGHSNATADETIAAIYAWSDSALTHLFNAMRALDHRESGIIGTILDRDDVYAEADLAMECM